MATKPVPFWITYAQFLLGMVIQMLLCWIKNPLILSLTVLLTQKWCNCAQWTMLNSSGRFCVHLPKRMDSFSLHMLPTLTAIINKSMSSGIMPDCLKEAMLTPTLKKPQLDPEDLNNYRLISNLPYLSKFIERVGAAQLGCYLERHLISEPFPSTYRKLHSTETALTYVTNCILCALDRQGSVFIILLDLSATFDVVDHKLLLSRLEDRVGLGGLIWDWVTSNLMGRYQYVSRFGSSPGPRPLTCGVPRVRCWGPSFLLYTLSLWET